MRFSAGECEGMHTENSTAADEAVRSVKTQDGNRGTAEGKGRCATEARRPITSSARAHGGNPEKDLTHGHAHVHLGSYLKYTAAESSKNDGGWRHLDEDHLER